MQLYCEADLRRSSSALEKPRFNFFYYICLFSEKLVGMAEVGWERGRI